MNLILSFLHKRIIHWQHSTPFCRLEPVNHMKCVFTDVLISFFSSKTMQECRIAFFINSYHQWPKIRNLFTEWIAKPFVYMTVYYYWGLHKPRLSKYGHRIPNISCLQCLSCLGLIGNSFLPATGVVSGTTNAQGHYAFIEFWHNDTQIYLTVKVYALWTSL